MVQLSPVMSQKSLDHESHELHELEVSVRDLEIPDRKLVREPVSCPNSGCQLFVMICPLCFRSARCATAASANAHFVVAVSHYFRLLRLFSSARGRHSGVCLLQMRLHHERAIHSRIFICDYSLLESA